MDDKSASIVRLIALFGGVVVVAALSGYLIIAWTLRAPSPGGDLDAMLQQMQLSEAQRSTVESVAAGFEERHQELLDAFRREQLALADLLRQEQEFSHLVEQAVVDIHRIHGQLQVLSIERFYAILKVLPADKGDELRELAATTLSRPD